MRLWNVLRGECLRIFTHSDYGKCLWNLIPFTVIELLCLRCKCDGGIIMAIECTSWIKSSLISSFSCFANGSDMHSIQPCGWWLLHKWFIGWDGANMEHKKSPGCRLVWPEWDGYCSMLYTRWTGFSWFVDHYSNLLM